MALTPKNFYRGMPGTSASAIYTAPNSAGTDYAIVKEIVACNTDVADRYLTVYSVESGGTADVTRAILDTVRVPAKTTAFFELSSVLENGDFLSAYVSSAATINLTISGVEEE